MAKPAGPGCNLDCDYCFYREKTALYPAGNRFRMTDEVLEAYVRNYIASIREQDEVAFTWQGGEPTLMGLDFFRRAVELQKHYGAGRNISNSFQTNGILLDETWCDFLRKNGFLVGLSLDGPEEIHDQYRRTLGGDPCHGSAMRALRLLQQHSVQYNVLATVTRHSSRFPLQVYEFLRETGVRFMQFLPVVERLPSGADAESGLRLGSPDGQGEENVVTEWSVQPKEYGLFLTAIFDQWVKRDVGETFVMNFEWALANFTGNPGAVCHHQPTCGRSVIVEHNGDVYGCDHYVYPQYRLGNLVNEPLSTMVDSPHQEQFGRDKFADLSEQCRNCKVVKGCWGGCPKHRFIRTENGGPDLNYLCEGFRHFFSHTAPYLKVMATLLASGRPASDIVGSIVLVKEVNQ